MAQYDAPEIEQDTTPTAGVCVSNCSIHLLDYHYYYNLPWILSSSLFFRL